MTASESAGPGSKREEEEALLRLDDDGACRFMRRSASAHVQQLSASDVVSRFDQITDPRQPII